MQTEGRERDRDRCGKTKEEGEVWRETEGEVGGEEKER